MGFGEEYNGNCELGFLGGKLPFPLHRGTMRFRGHSSD